MLMIEFLILTYCSSISTINNIVKLKILNCTLLYSWEIGFYFSDIFSPNFNN